MPAALRPVSCCVLCLWGRSAQLSCRLAAVPHQQQQRGLCKPWTRVPRPHSLRPLPGLFADLPPRAPVPLDGEALGGAVQTSTGLVGASGPVLPTACTLVRLWLTFDSGPHHPPLPCSEAPPCSELWPKLFPLVLGLRSFLTSSCPEGTVETFNLEEVISVPNGLLYLRERMRTKKMALWWGNFLCPEALGCLFCSQTCPGGHGKWRCAAPGGAVGAWRAWTRLIPWLTSLLCDLGTSLDLSGLLCFLKDLILIDFGSERTH